MDRFLNGALAGMGLGLLIAPMKGEEMRRLLRERYEHLRSTLPEPGQLQQGGQQVAARLSQATSTVKGAAQCAEKLAHHPLPASSRPALYLDAPSPVRLYSARHCGKNGRRFCPPRGSCARNGTQAARPHQRG